MADGSYLNARGCPMKFENIAALAACTADTPLGTTGWVTITQPKITQFADTTGDHQWIHVDEERAKSGPFGKTIAHGFLIQSLCAPMLFELLEVGGVLGGLNAGADKTRFLTPVTVDSRVRGKGTFKSARQTDKGLRVVVSIEIELEGAPNPAFVGDIISVFM